MVSDMGETWSHVEFAAVKEDADTAGGEAVEAAGGVLDGLVACTRRAHHERLTGFQGLDIRRAKADVER